MAVIKRGILGGFQNKIANVVGSSWKGIATMRSLPISVANPRTELQVNQRTKFKTMVKIGSFLLTAWIKPLWDRFAQQESGYNAWLRNNIDAFNQNGGTTDVNWSMSIGTLAPVVVDTVVANSADNSLTVTWNPIPVGDGSPTDRIYIAYVFEALDRAHGFASVAARSAGTVTVDFPVDIIDNPAARVFVAARSVDGTKVSSSYPIYNAAI